LEAKAGPVILTGPNGAGKTNILEALSFLAPGRGLRRARLWEAAARTAGADAPWAVAARIEGPDGTRDIGTGRAAGTERRIVRIDGTAARSQAALAELVSILWLTPAMDRLFGEGASGRRRFLDRLVLGVDPAHGPRAAAYDRALRERVRLLREGRADAAWLNTLEETMARHGIAMAQARRETVRQLNDACRQGIGPFPAARLTVAGNAEAVLDELSPDHAEMRVRHTLAASRRADGESGGAAIGPHRSDLRVRHAGKDLPAEQCSTGEQKAVLVAIILGQARTQAALRGRPPILLLDEIAAHLDQTRRAALFDELCALPAQSWLTGTDASMFAELSARGQYFHVTDGTVTRP
jgi:DNA replication and repair protein RecF